jgi:hypothetical protein
MVMKDVAEKLNPMPGAQYLGPGRVLEYDEAGRRVQVLLEPTGSGLKARRAWARLAIPYGYKPNWGDTLLVAGEDPDGFYVIGVLDTQGRGLEPERAVVLGNGARAVVAGPPQGEKLRVFSKEGGLIFEYDADTGKSRVDIPVGDLEVTTKEGHIAFTSAKGIRFCSQTTIDMQSAELGINARRGDILIETAKYQGKKFSGEISHIKLIMDRLETFADKVIAKAKNVYKTVEGLTQLRTGRLRTLVERTYQLKSKKALLKAEEDFKVRAEKIYLG